MIIYYFAISFVFCFFNFTILFPLLWFLFFKNIYPINFWMTILIRDGTSEIQFWISLKMILSVQNFPDFLLWASVSKIILRQYLRVFDTQTYGNSDNFRPLCDSVSFFLFYTIFVLTFVRPRPVCHLFFQVGFYGS